ncbi:MAG: hypothetical protein U0K91_02065, partial [Acutalibacteraceae bacterium]|nr:hypothetical protein [Acutalibacteraceae bacterium]
MKKTLKRCFSAILAVAVILVGMPIILPAQAESYDTTYTNEYYYPSGTAFISSFSVAASGSSDTAWNSIGNAGYTHLNIDLNKKADGDYIYSGYKTSTDPKNAIRALACWNGENPPKSFTHASGAVYYPVKSPSGEIIDLNKGAGGDYIYFYYTTDDKAGPPMIALDWEEDSHINDSGNQCQTPVVWLNSNKGGVQGNPASLNQNAGGRQIHFFYNTTGTKVVTKDLRDSMKVAKPLLDKSSQYTSASFSTLKTAYNNAENITNDYNPDGLSSSYPQSTIDSYKTALNNAIAGLQTTVYLNGNGGTISPSS